MPMIIGQRTTKNRVIGLRLRFKKTLRKAGAEKSRKVEIIATPRTLRLLLSLLEEEELGTSGTSGKTVTVLPSDAALTPRQAAASLGVSHSFLLELMERGALPYRRDGAHRRIAIPDLLAYKREFVRRVGVMEELAAETAALGLSS
jgi:excisionase family DNA binding protein